MKVTFRPEAELTNLFYGLQWFRRQLHVKLD